MEDIKLFAYNKPFVANSNETFLEYGSNAITMPSAKDDEVIINKVLKFLLTEKGTDLFDPEYGSNWVILSRSISIDNLDRLSIEVTNDIERCKSYLKDSSDQFDTILFNGFRKVSVTDINQILVLISIKIIKPDNSIIHLALPVNR